MTLLPFRSITCIVTILLVGVQCANVGDKCTTDTDCNENVCVNEKCQQPLLNDGYRKRCGYRYCQPWETCIRVSIQCLQGAVCKPPPPRCLPNRYIDDTPAVDPVPVECGNTTCQPGERCEHALVKCREGAVCTPPPPKCFPITSDEISPAVLPKLVDPCATVRCRSNYTCRTVTINCLVSPCPPPRAECVPVDPCASTTCIDGYKCAPSADNPTVGKCVPSDPCAAVQCKPGYKCRADTHLCKSLPCPSPSIECVPVETCAKTCPEGYECALDAADPTVETCMAKDPCKTKQCGPGYRCQAVAFNCFIGPCPPVVAECIPDNPCSGKTCREGEICTQTESDPAVAECVLGPCATARCGWGKKCIHYAQYCKHAPCPRPVSECAPDVQYDPCAAVFCGPGTVCSNVPVTSCEVPPCPKYQATCRPPADTLS